VPEFSAGIGSALIAAAAVFYVYRSRRSTDKATGISSNEQLLLPVKTSAGGTGGSGEDPGVAALRRQLASEAQYDEASCFPLNTAAKKLTALDWSTGNARSQVSHVVNLPFVELAQATQSFDSFNELGSGGSCDVFRGALFGLQVAVKRLEAEASDWSTKQFTSEMELLTKVAHPHVVRLLAYSTDGPQRCLVLELCTGGTLNDRTLANRRAGSRRHRHCRGSSACGSPSRFCLRSRTCTRSAHRSSTGSLTPTTHNTHCTLLAPTLLHTHALPLVRSDLKTPNVLLDANGDAKVADFGAVRAITLQGQGDGACATHLTTMGERPGTRGYMVRAAARTEQGL
jgi:serine/threonine protein kinase